MAAAAAASKAKDRAAAAAAVAAAAAEAEERTREAAKAEKRAAAAEAEAAAAVAEAVERETAARLVRLRARDSKKRPSWWPRQEKGSHREVLRLRPADVLPGAVPGKFRWEWGNGTRVAAAAAAWVVGGDGVVGYCEGEGGGTVE